MNIYKVYRTDTINKNQINYIITPAKNMYQALRIFEENFKEEKYLNYDNLLIEELTEINKKNKIQYYEKWA